MAKAGRVQKSSFRTDRSDATGGRLLGPLDFDFAIDRPAARDDDMMNWRNRPGDSRRAPRAGQMREPDGPCLFLR